MSLQSSSRLSFSDLDTTKEKEIKEKDDTPLKIRQLKEDEYAWLEKIAAEWAITKDSRNPLTLNSKLEKAQTEVYIGYSCDKNSSLRALQERCNIEGFAIILKQNRTMRILDLQTNPHPALKDLSSFDIKLAIIQELAKICLESFVFLRIEIFDSPHIKDFYIENNFITEKIAEKNLICCTLNRDRMALLKDSVKMIPTRSFAYPGFSNSIKKQQLVEHKQPLVDDQQTKTSCFDWFNCWFRKNRVSTL